MVRISIITVTYQCADIVSDCLESVASQTYRNVEHIVVDGASTDGTVDILSRHAQGITTLISEPDRGMYDALNKGLAQARGDVIGLLHADDVYADREVLARVASSFDDPNMQAVYGDLQYVRRDDRLRVIRHWRAGGFSKDKLLGGWMPPHPTLFLRRSVYERYGDFDTRYRIASDYDLMLRVLLGLEGKVSYLPQVFVKMRLGGASNRSLNAVIRKSLEDWRILRAHGLGWVTASRALAWKNVSKLGQFFG